MGATNSFETDLLRHIFLNLALEEIGDTAGLLPSAVLGELNIALFTEDPGEAGSLVNEASYTGYARVAVPRGATGWTELEGQIRNANAITFPICTGGSETVTHFGICRSDSGGELMFYGELPSPALIFTEVQLQFDANTLSLNID